MMGDDQHDAPSPWAPGGSIDRAGVTAPSSEFRFESASSGSPGPTGFHGPDAGHPQRRIWVAVAAVAVVVLVGGVVATTLGVDDAGDAGDAVPVPDTGAALDSATSSSLEAAAPETRSGGPTERLVLAAAPQEFLIDVAPGLGTINPTEVVALAESELYEISLPSGRVRVTDLGFATGSANLAANDQVAVVWPTPESRAQAVGIDGAVGVPLPRVDDVTWSPATSHLYLWTSDTNMEPATELRVREQALEWQTAGWLDDDEEPSPFLHPDGSLLRADTGGVYRIDSRSTELFTTGDVVSTGANHLLLRECDAARQCSLVTVDAIGERRDWPVDLPAGIDPQSVGGLSPGGDALLFSSLLRDIDMSTGASSDAGAGLGVLELTDGAAQPLFEPPTDGATAAWDTTGAGVIVVDENDDLLYIERFTGASTHIGADLPPLRSVFARRPATSAACEVVPLALEQFSLAALPSAEVLARLIQFLPTEVSEPLAALADGGPDASATALEMLLAYAEADCRLVVL